MSRQSRDLHRVLVEQAPVGASEPIFRKPRNSLEERASQLVVEVLGVQLLLRFAQIGAHLCRKFAQTGIGKGSSSRPGGNQRRHKGNRAGTSSGTSVAENRKRFAATHP